MAENEGVRVSMTACSGRDVERHEADVEGFNAMVEGLRALAIRYCLPPAQFVELMDPADLFVTALA